ncbi:PilN domain-containing protein [Pseudorhodoferax sp.]|uniref:PilN domain-containing protein n=1 Tax=Pseudorhodoferax sp. TaxID=1993553 RepID=UPI002DD63063|nr:PilN domain-containing protein [Pseudorhodoferax sp.]
MILINLLPYREARRKQRKQAFFSGLALAALVGLLAIALAWVLLQTLIGNQQSRNSYLQGEIDRLDAQIKDIATLREEIDSLTRRQNAVEALQGERNLPVHVLNELARIAPEGVYFTSVKQDNKEVQLQGLAQTQERISELLRNTSRDAQWLLNPRLGEIKLAQLAANARESKRLFDFSMKVTIKSTTPEPDGKASAPAKG